ncbi:LOW QUALITY PROTEIN: hypothetical protein ACHAW6_004020 [Cyclotella cf. meneghiniana]
MQYYTFMLDEQSQDLCAIITPFGIYKYMRLLIQSIMESVLANTMMLLYALMMLVPSLLIGITVSSGLATYYTACEKMASLLTHQNVYGQNWLAGTLAHSKKSKTLEDLINAILHMDCPWNSSELCIFIGCVNYYYDIWPCHAHIPKPLTDHSKLKKHAPIPWTSNMQTTFNKMHALMVADALTAYPDHNKWFDVYMDVPFYQLGACIVKEGCPVAYFSCKLSKSQKNSTVMENEMLSIVATLNEF